MEEFAIFLIGDQSVTISFGNSISEEQNNKVIALRNWIEQNPFPGIDDLVIAYSSLTIIFDLIQVKSQTSGTAFDFVRNYLRRASEKISVIKTQPQREIRIPVCYEAPYSIDKENLIFETQLNWDEIIGLHCGRKYKIYMIGFLPGFPYMADVDKKIALPRKQNPRSIVEAGSVGIAGIQTGIYPIQSPGGWNIIGRTPMKLFNKNDKVPVKIEVGNVVEFYPISKTEFVKLEGQLFL